jgi:hypothetical protein
MNMGAITAESYFKMGSAFYVSRVYSKVQTIGFMILVKSLL